MPKRPRASDEYDSDAAGPAAGRVAVHGLAALAAPARGARSIADLFPLPELFLRVLGFLAPEDLARAQAVNRYWQSMALDPQLWKRLYLRRYPHPHYPLSRQTTPSVSPSTPPPTRRLRPIARLPSRAFPPPSPTPSARASSPASAAGSTPAPAVGAGAAVEKGAGRAVALDRGWVRNEGVDWKSMFRLGSNWSNGNVLSESTIPLTPSPSPSAPRPEANDVDSPSETLQHIALFPHFIVTSSPDSPLVHVYSSSAAASPSASSSTSTLPASVLGIVPPPPGWSTPARPDTVTAICADQAAAPIAPGAPAPARLAVFYQSGGFAVVSLRFDGGRLAWTREALGPPSARPRRVGQRRAGAADAADPVVLAALHWPVLVSCTRAFHLAVHVLPRALAGTDDAVPATPARPTCIQTMHSAVSFHPAALTILPDLDGGVSGGTASGASGHFKAALTYCTPLYPAAWTVAVQELAIDAGRGTVDQRGALSVGAGEPAGAAAAWPRKLRPPVGVRGRPAGVGSDGRWCVLAGRDSQIHVFALPPASAPGPAPDVPLSRLPRVSRPPRAQQHIAHAQTLLAHRAAVTSVALGAGRCVSAGADGRVLVWELDEVDADAGADAGVDGDADAPGARLGRTVGHVEIRLGGRRERARQTAPARSVAAQGRTVNSGDDDDDDDDVDDDENDETTGGPGWRADLPHPKSIATAARTLFLARPPDRLPPASPGMTGMTATAGLAGMAGATVEHARARPAIRQVAFDEEKVVGIVDDGAGEAVRVWSFGA